MPRRICEIEGCGKLARARGWCQMHYKRWQIHGNPQADRPERARRQEGMNLQGVLDRELSRAKPVGNGHGYPRVNIGGNMIKVSRVAVAVKEGFPLDGDWVTRHDCDNRTCINPDCLRSGTQQDNVNDMHSRGRFVSKPVGESGYRGVTKTRNGKWSARKYAKGRTYCLGTYPTKEEASDACQEFIEEPPSD